MESEYSLRDYSIYRPRGYPVRHRRKVPFDPKVEISSESEQMVREIVASVLADRTNRRITVEAAAPAKPAKGKSVVSKEKSADKPAKEPRKRKAGKKDIPAGDAWVGQPCPVCGKGVIIKGKTAYGCSEWRNGCTFRKPFGEE